MSDVRNFDVPTVESELPKPLAEAKQLLEIEKLKLEMRFIKRNHYAQLFNTVGLVIVALLVLQFFQRPQIEQLEANRIATERHQVGLLVLDVVKLQSGPDRRRMLAAFLRMYPDHPFISDIAESDRLLASVAGPSPTPQSDGLGDDMKNPAGPAPDPTLPAKPGQEIDAAGCKTLRANLKALRESEAMLLRQAEGASMAPPGRGCGSICSSFRGQADNLNRKIGSLQQMADSGCTKVP